MVTADRYLLRPAVSEVARAVHRSRSFAYVADPEDFLIRLSNIE
jgi:uncharacterized protein YchJ